MSKKKNITTWILTVLLAYIFVAAGSTKLLGVKMMVQEFHHFGYPDWFRLLIGAVEVAAVALLLMPPTASLAAAILGSVMVGAIVTHFHSHEAPLAAVPVMVLMLLSFVGYVRWPQALGRRLPAVASSLRSPEPGR